MKISHQSLLRMPRKIQMALPLSVLLTCGVPHARPADAHVRGKGILVFAPHPDDAELCCSGIMLQALARGEQVHVVVLTNGDASTSAAGGLAGKPDDQLGVKDYLALSRSRQLQSQKGLAVLGMKPSALIFLGYPDAGLDPIYREASAIPFTSPFTQKSATYAFVQMDYHTATHESAAPYTREAVLDDIAEIIRTLQPRQIFVTTEADAHPDHSVAFLFVRDAIHKTGYHGELYTYLIHAAEGLQWPWPWGITLQSPFEPPHANNRRATFKLPWPPEIRLFITPAQAHLKLLAIRCHKLTMLDPIENEDHEASMESFVKSDEVFWKPTLIQP